MNAQRQPLEDRMLIGVDVGGTKCAAGLVCVSDGKVFARRLMPTQPHRGGDAVLADVIATIRSLQREAGELQIDVVAIGIGVAELVGTDGRILSGATIKWLGLDLRKLLHDATGLPATVDADVRSAARAEARLGAGRPFRSFLYVTVGTGISASLVLDQSPFFGARGLTGTFASAPGLIPNNHRQLVSGPPLESFAAGPAIVSRFSVVRPGFTGTGRDVLSLADSGDNVAISVVTSAAEALGAAIGQLVNVLDPEAVVMGGGLGLAEGLYRTSMLTALRRHIWSAIQRDLPVLSAQLGNDAGLIGAALGACN
jgi:predicted NBD/HSP70 family sugar kinase